MSICPCLDEVINKIFGKTKQSKSYEGAREFQQEEFINPHHHEIFLSDTIDTPLTKIQQSPIESQISQYFKDQPKQQQKQILQILNVNDQLQQHDHHASQVISQEKDIEELLRQQLGLTTEQVTNTAQQDPSPLQLILQQNSNINFQSFIINLDSYDPFFGLLVEKTKNLPEMFAKKGVQLTVDFPNNTNLSIQIIEPSKSNIFLIRYQLDCEYSYYLSILKNQKLLYSLSSLITEAKIFEAFKPNLTLNTLKFKRIGSLEPREYNYLKYQNGAKAQYWQIYINQQQHVQSSNGKACELFCAKNIRQYNAKHLSISQYIQVDLQAKNDLNIVTRVVNQLRSYLNNLQEYILNNYEGESA